MISAVARHAGIPKAVVEIQQSALLVQSVRSAVK